MVLTTKEASYIIVLGIVIYILPISSTVRRQERYFWLLIRVTCFFNRSLEDDWRRL